MLAGDYMGNKAMSVMGAEERPPGPGEVQLAVAYTGICGLVSKVVPLTDLASAFDLLESGRAMKVLVDCGGGEL